MYNYYTGIGSRGTPKIKLREMADVGRSLAELGWVLRSGKAEGADTAFQQGAEIVDGSLGQIYIPWRDFKNNSVRDVWDIVPDDVTMRKCQSIASSFHPAWERCSRWARLLHGRNVCQVLGDDLSTPSKFVLYYAEVKPDGSPKGGTAMAVSIAKHHGIPTINMKQPDWSCRLKKIIKGTK